MRDFDEIINTSEYNLLAGVSTQSNLIDKENPLIVVFDSGIGGLSVFSELLKLHLSAHFIYVADSAGFPYGSLSEMELQERVSFVLEKIIDRFQPDLIVIACGTASTLATPFLREKFSIPFVATVPAIKPAVALSKSRKISVFATKGTVSRVYTKELIKAYAQDCEVTLVGSSHLATLVEQKLRGEKVSDQALRDEILPCFVEADQKRTDVIVLACTHYPLIQTDLERLSPWPVTFLDPAPAIARRVSQLVIQKPNKVDLKSREILALFTSGEFITEDLKNLLLQWNISQIDIYSIPK